MSEQDQAIARLIEAARPIAQLAGNYRHRGYEVDARVPAALLIALADALAEVDEGQWTGHGESDR